MQLIAMLTMLIDHVGAVFFKDQLLWRIIGRIAFPIYAYCIVLGYMHTRNLKLYMRRLFFIAAVSQIPFMLAFGIMGVNAVGTLLVCIAVLYLIENRKKSVWIPVAAASVILMEVLDFDYGLYGLLLVLIYKYSKSHTMVFSHFVLNLLYLFLKDWLIEGFSLIPTLVIAYVPALYRRLEHRSIPSWLWRSFYPAHLAVIAILELLLTAK
ncbi:TraX family protein [Paenibacillus filicis]|uniref:TraX family protein n=1 Tax=Paenibacillus gyeongsangnamensis TaxID=3388067 RepID=A0ABT4Q725_9BACL|nr:TraX family protein [Paenibacillus filicis]MCZ8512663.1 TraX family protein [Paenibacillus filicis]